MLCSVVKIQRGKPHLLLLDGALATEVVLALVDKGHRIAGAIILGKIELVEASLAHRPLAPGIRRRMFMPLLQTLKRRAVETLLAIELGQAGVQDVEAVKLLEDRLHQLDGAVRLLLVVGHGG